MNHNEIISLDYISTSINCHTPTIMYIFRYIIFTYMCQKEIIKMHVIQRWRISWIKERVIKLGSLEK